MPTALELATHEWPPADGRADARVAVLVHGMTGWWRTWWRVGPALADRGWRVIAVDQRGHGDSPAGPPCTIDDLARDLGAAIEAHATPPVDALIGHSLGARVSLRLALLRPDIARRLVLEDPPGIIRADDLEWQAQQRAEVAAARERPEDEVRRELAENPAWLEEDARQDVEGRARCAIENVIATVASARGSVPEEVTELRIPARFILAAPDRSVMPEAPRRRLRATLPPGSDVVVLDGGHTLHRDCFDGYMAAIDGFLA